MKTLLWIGALALSTAGSSAACGSGPGGTEVIIVPQGVSSDAGSGLPGSSADGGTPASTDGSAPSPASGDSGAATGVPCDVATMLATLCTGCHSDPPAPGALAGLVTYSDLMMTSHEDPSKNEALDSLARMESTSSPMPPGGGATAANVKVLQDWISAKYPKGSCGGADGGEGGTPPPSMGVFTGAPAFSSMVGPHTHNAGQDCMRCHTPGSGSDDAPSFSFGGTLYDGTGNPVAGAEVRLVDSTGTPVSVYTSDVGTFYSRGNGFSAPAHVGVRNASAMQNMLTALQSTVSGPASTGGACSACHCTGSSCTVPEVHLP